MLVGTNLEHTRSYNRRVVLEMVRLHGPLSRTDVARRSGLSLQTISNIADELSDADLIVALDPRTARRGKPTRELAINPKGGFTYGISLDHRRLVMVLVDMAGRPHSQLAYDLNDSSPAEVLGLIGAAAAKMATKAPGLKQRLWGVGMVIPALVEQGRLISFGPTSLPAWEGFPLEAELAALLGVPAIIQNDATAAAIAERLYGVGRTLRNFFYIYLGAGVGGGMIFGGQPYQGGSGRAGELGHVVVRPDGLPCLCGNRGCLERYASLSAAQAVLTGEAEGSSPVDPSLIMRALEEGSPALAAWIESAGAGLRTAVGIIENLLDPDAVVIGGPLPDRLLDALIAAMDPMPPSLVSRGARAVPRVVKSEAGLDSPALGAAALPLFDGMNPSFALLMKGANAGPAALSVMGG